MTTSAFPIPSQRKLVRLAYQDYLQNYGVPYLGTVFAARPVIAEEEAYTQTMLGMAVESSDNGSCALLVVNITDEHRVSEAIAGETSLQDSIAYHMLLELAFASTSGDAIGAQLDYDDVVSTLFVAIRANPTPGGANVVWSAAQFETGLDHHQDVPFSTDEGLTTLIFGRINFDAYSWLAGSGV